MAAADPVPPETSKSRIAHEAVAVIPGAQDILFASASPAAEEVFVVAQMSNEAFGGSFFVVRLDTNAKDVEAVMEGTSVDHAEAPVWSPDGKTAYLAFKSGKHSGDGSETCQGLFAWDRRTGKVGQLLKDSIGGLTISPDGRLAAFWDYSRGNNYNLRVWDLQTKTSIVEWSEERTTADGLALSKLAFTPQGNSLLVQLYIPREEYPLEKYDIDDGKVSFVASKVQSLVRAGKRIYFVQSFIGAFTSLDFQHRLMKWSPGMKEPVTAVADFPYSSLSASPDGRWIVGGNGSGSASGTAIYDTRTSHVQTVGKSCSNAVITAAGKVRYTLGNELVADATLCGGPPPSIAPRE